MSMFEMMANFQQLLAAFQDPEQRDILIAKFTAPAVELSRRVDVLTEQLRAVEDNQILILVVLRTQDPVAYGEAFDTVTAQRENPLLLGNGGTHA